MSACQKQMSVVHCHCKRKIGFEAYFFILPFKEGYSTTGLVEKIVTLVKEGKL